MYIYLHRCIYIYIILYRYLDKTSGFNDNYRNMELRYILGLRRIPKGFWMQSGSTQTKMTTGKTCFFTCFGPALALGWLLFGFLFCFPVIGFSRRELEFLCFARWQRLMLYTAIPEGKKTQNIVTHEWWIQCMLKKLKT